MKKIKLVLVSSIIHGKRFSKFVLTPVDSDGKVRVEQSDLPGCKNLARGTTIVVG